MNRKKVLIHKLFAALWAIGILGCSGPNVIANEDRPAEFWFSADPHLELLHLRFTGGRTSQQIDYRLFADGRLVIETKAIQAGRKIRSLNSEAYEVSQTDLETVLQHAIKGGLADLDEQRHQELKKLRPKYFASDAGTIWLKLCLPHYRREGMTAEESVDRSFSLSGGIDSWIHSYPEIEEFHCLKDLILMVTALKREKGYSKAAALLY